MGRSRRDDAYGRRAKREGFAARSVYKLEEIHRRTQILKRGSRVLDLGASPGSWSQYAAERVGPKGYVLAVDLKPLEVALPGHAHAQIGDVNALDAEALGGPASYDIVLSDMAPNTSGQRHADQYRSFSLWMRALEVSDDMLREGGDFAGKIFQGPELEQARKAATERFREVRLIRPKATRQESYEVFLVGLGRKSRGAHQR